MRAEGNLESVVPVSDVLMELGNEYCITMINIGGSTFDNVHVPMTLLPHLQRGIGSHVQFQMKRGPFLSRAHSYLIAVTSDEGTEVATSGAFAVGYAYFIGLMILIAYAGIIWCNGVSFDTQFEKFGLFYMGAGALFTSFAFYLLGFYFAEVMARQSADEQQSAV